MSSTELSTRAVVSPRSSATQSPVLRLTRRGRVLLVGVPMMLLTVFLLIAAASFTSVAQAAGDQGPLTNTQEVSVAAGETLWALAAEFAPDRDPRDVVADIVEINALESSVVQAGQTLSVPVAP